MYTIAMNFVLPSQFVVPEVVTSQFHLKAGDVVADLGAGSGFFLKHLSAAVGPTGVVYACEIQKPLVEKLGAIARAQGLQNVTTLWCDLEEENGIKLPSSSLDAALLINTLFQFQLKAVALEEVRRVLRPGAVLHIIDWTESFGGIGPQPAAVVTKEAAITLCEAQHFVFEREFPAGEHHYGITMRKV